MGPNGESCYQPLPQRVAGIKHATKVSAGEDHTLVLTVIYLPELPLQDIFVSTGSDAADLSASHSASNAFDGDEDTENNYKVENRGRYRKRSNSVTDPTRKQSCHDKAKSDESIDVFVNRVASLSDICQREVAKSVNIKNVVSTLLFAELYATPLLASYTLDFIERFVVDILM